MADQWEVASEAPATGTVTRDDFKKVLNKTFGPGKWVPTSGFRSPAAEDKLRKKGAGTVPKGQTSSHSEGTEDAPGAFDFQVPGMSQKEAASKLAKADPRFEHVFAEARSGGQGEHVHATAALKPANDASGWEVASETPVKPAVAPPKAPPRPGFASDMRERTQANLGGLDATVADVKAHPTNMLNAPKLLGSVANFASTAIDTPLRAGVDQIVRPFVDVHNRLFHKQSDPHGVTDMLVDTAESLIGVGGEKTALEKMAPAERNALKAQAERLRAGLPAEGGNSHAARVQRVRERGIYVTPGMEKGGDARRTEEAQEDSRYVGQTRRQAQRKSVESFNKAAVNEPLKQIGETSPSYVPVGRESIADMDAKIGRSYEAVLPKAKARMDDPFKKALDEATEETRTLPPEKQAQFKAILDREVTRHFGDKGVVDGKTFKRIESVLSQKARAFKGSQDPDQRDMGHLLDDVNGALRDSVERHSPADVRQRIKDVNRAYAMAERVGQASVNRRDPDGVFTTGDLQTAVKRGDTSRGKRQLRHGDALMQQFADDAHAVLPDKMPNSGSPARGAILGRGLLGAAGAAAVAPHSIPAMAAGGAADLAVPPLTNALARASLARHAARSPANYLAKSVRASSPLVNHRQVGPAMGTVNALKLMSQQPGQ